jgi:formylglycine-generating enzyme required for sulfatase activity
VTLTQDYYIGVFECTQRQWELVMGTKPSYFSNADYYATRPVEQVSYDMIRGTGAQAGASWPACGHTVDATSFMGKLQTKTGLVFDLPTEAQWEHACRAGTMTALNSGKDLTSAEQDDAMAEVGRYWYNGGSGSTKNCTTDKGTAKVGSYLPNAWGLYDMHGNVDEWCLDWYGASTSSMEAETDPTGPNTGTFRVLRSGCYSFPAHTSRAASRSYNGLSATTSSYGFRVSCLP